MIQLFNFCRYDLHQGLRNCLRFFSVVWRFRAWDFVFTLDLFRAGLRMLKPCLEQGMEIDETRLPKIDAITRVITLLDHVIDDQYLALIEADEGPLSTNWVTWTDTNIPGRKKLQDRRDEQQQQHDMQIFEKADALETHEWAELWKILHGSSDMPGSDLRGWWD